MYVLYIVYIWYIVYIYFIVYTIYCILYTIYMVVSSGYQYILQRDYIFKVYIIESVAPYPI